MKLKPKLSNHKVMLISCFLILGGCRANTDSLDNFYLESEKQGYKEIEALTEVASFEVLSYAQVESRSPFVLPRQPERLTQPKAKKTCWQPKYRKRTGTLEKYSLKKLHLKGVMGGGSDITALVQTPTGNVVKVRKGNYMGTNNGQVIEIKSKHITLKETLPDGIGCWQTRYVKLALKY